MQLNAANTAVVLDSTADFPEGVEHHANRRMVPLYVRFGDESNRDHVELDAADFYARLRETNVMPTMSQPTPGDFAASMLEPVVGAHTGPGTVGFFWWQDDA